MAVEPDGTPHVTYDDSRDDALKIASRPGATWEIAGVAVIVDAGLCSHMRVGADGRFHNQRP